MAIDTTSHRTDAAPAPVRTPGRIGIGMVGYAFMGVAHSQGWRNARSFFDPALVPDLVAIGGRDADAAGDMARRFDWQHVETDWRALVARPTSTSSTSARRGTRTPRSPSRRSRPASTCSARSPSRTPSPRRVPWPRPPSSPRRAASAPWWASPTDACRRSRWPGSSCSEGRVGEIRHVRAQYLQDWLVDPESPLTWRLQKDRAGSGALGDIGAHIIDLTRFVTGEQISGVSAVTETFVRERPAPRAPCTGCPPRPGPAGARSPSTTRRSSSRASPAERSRPSRPPGSRRGARTPSGSRSTGRAAASRSTSRT